MCVTFQDFPRTGNRKKTRVKTLARRYAVPVFACLPPTVFLYNDKNNRIILVVYSHKSHRRARRPGKSANFLKPLRGDFHGCLAYAPVLASAVPLQWVCEREFVTPTSWIFPSRNFVNILMEQTIRRNGPVLREFPNSFRFSLKIDSWNV